MIDKQEDLSGLPETLIANAAQAAKDAGMEGKCIYLAEPERDAVLAIFR